MKRVEFRSKLGSNLQLGGQCKALDMEDLGSYVNKGMHNRTWGFDDPQSA